MILHVGAVSRRVVEVAAAMHVDAIVASRRQVEGGHGYIGMNQEEFVRTVNDLSTRLTDVIRDHGNDTTGLRDDIESGFDGFHFDPTQDGCELDTQLVEVERFAHAARELRFSRHRGFFVEIGGERSSFEHNLALAHKYANTIKEFPERIVTDAGGHVRGERQIGRISSPVEMADRRARARAHQMMVKAHNFDWVERDPSWPIDYFNIAMELAAVEIDAIMVVAHPDRAHELLEEAFDSGAWRRWFPEEVIELPTWFAAARCAARYILRKWPNERLEINEGGERFIRGRIKDAIDRIRNH